MSELNDDPKVIAKEQGLLLCLPGDNELFIDIDSDEDFAHFEDMRAVLQTIGGGVTPSIEIDSVLVSPSRNGGQGRHVRLRFARSVNTIERIAFQAAMGSDRKRELLSLLRIRMELDRLPTVFFEQPA